MITYGHEKYIKEAIDSILAQKTNFTIEFIISNDKSPDNSDEIIKNAIKNAPENFIIKYYNQPINLGMNANFDWALKQCTGEYIALCEGDDYWTNESKAQIQVDFLDSHLDFSMYFHKAENPTEKVIQDIEKKKYNDIEILNNWYIQAGTVMFRNNLTPNEYALLSDKNVFFPDIILFIIIANKGKMWGTNENMSLYRFNEGSFTNSEKSIEYYEKLFNHLRLISTIYDSKYKPYNKHRVKSQAYKLFRHYALKGNPKTIKYLLHYIKN